MTMVDDNSDFLQPTTSSTAWQPSFFRPQNEPDAETLAKLLRDDPSVQVFDSIFGQLTDLIKTRHPRKSLTKNEIQQLVDDQLSGVPIRLYGVWVYYPWSHRLVHLLEE